MNAATFAVKSRCAVHVLGRRATAEGRRGFPTHPPRRSHPAKPSRRGATIEPSPHDQRSISFAPMPPAFNRRSATNHSCVIAIRGLKPTATIISRSATDGISTANSCATVGNAGSGDSLVLVLGRRATAEGRRGFPPTVGHPAKPSRRGATIETVIRADNDRLECQHHNR